MEEITYLIPCTLSSTIILILIGIIIWSFADRADENDEYNRIRNELDEIIKEARENGDIWENNKQ